MVSIVMSTYNGEKYIEEQLDSIRNQTRKADEVIISDDCSSDSTYEKVQQYIEKYHLSGWSVSKNEKNCGWEKNFMKTIAKASGDYIFLADQDDIWKEEKLEKMTAFMEENPQILVLVSDYEPFYMDNAVDKARNIEKLNSNGKLEKYEFDKKFLYIKRPGCVYCIRKTFAEKAAGYWYEKYPHDALFWRLSNISGGLYIYREPLILFRRHTSNASSVAVTSLEKKLEDIEYYNQVMKQLKTFIRREGIPFDRSQKKIFHKVNNYCKYRLRFLKDRNLASGVRLLFYVDCYYALKTYLADWFVVVFKKGIAR